MKKQVIAAAVAAAFAVPAVAQVTVSGNVEAGWASAKRNTAASSTGTGATAYTYNGVASAVVGTPVIRFAGREDLGGGLIASFQLDFEHNTANGAVDSQFAGSATTFAGADLSVSTVGLSGGFGSITLGKSALRTRDGGGLYRFYGNQGRLAADTTKGSVQFNSSDELVGFAEYVTPTIQGFSASYGQADNGRFLVTNPVGTSETEGGIAAKTQGWSIRGSLAPVNFQYGSETASANGATTKQKWDTLAANATFGPIRVGVVNVEHKSTADVKSRALGVHTAYQLTGPLSIGVNSTNYTTASTSGKTSVTVLVAKYDLSKRTSVNTSYQSVNSGATATLIGGSRGLGVRAISGTTNTGYNLSVVHSF